MATGGQDVRECFHHPGEGGESDEALRWASEAERPGVFAMWLFGLRYLAQALVRLGLRLRTSKRLCGIDAGN